MENNNSWLSHLKSFLSLSFNILVTVPSLLYYFSDGNKKFLFHTPKYIGLLPLCIGLYFFISCNWYFKNIGKGTLAAWNPPKKLVIEGLYKYTRNPMITGALMILIGEAFLLNNYLIIFEAIALFILSTVKFILSEEPLLLKRFGKDYEDYKKRVPRWFPNPFTLF
jgi:protein-S-isoprenylcysteine O-methyltransferase Ste14